MVKLKPCPWCGSSPTLLVNQIDEYPKRHAYVCGCLRCHSRAPLGVVTDIWGNTAEEAREEAVRRWNRRVKA